MLFGASTINLCVVVKYLVSDLDEPHEDDDDKQVVNEADYSDDAVNDLEYKIPQVVRLQRRQRCDDVFRDVTRHR